MKVYYDLHIHSALSPCADDDMTPNNIINMALLKGLDVIAVTDHNTTKNIKTIYELGEAKGIKIIPGIEVQTKEEVHLLCYFYNLKECLAFGDIVYKNLPNIKNNIRIFGRQLVMDINDDIVFEENKLLLVSSNLTINDIFNLVGKKGAVVPAHVDRSSYSIIYNLGFIPYIKNLKAIEISNYIDKESFLKVNKDLTKYKIIISSDAHHLGRISERINSIECNDFNNILEWLST